MLERVTGVPVPVPSVAAVRELSQAIRAADVILLHDCLYLSNILAFLIARRYGVPVMVVQHVGMVRHRNLLMRAAMSIGNTVFARRMLASAQQAVFISETTQRYFASVRFRRPAVLIFNGVDSDMFHPAGQDAVRALRQQFELPQDGVVALFVGRFVEKKGLRVLHEMALRTPEIQWAFAGSGPLDPRGWQLRNVRAFSSIRDGRLADLYRASDVLVLPSTGEGLPLVVQEALASGLPVICGSETATADPELAHFVRGVTLSHTNDRLSADACLVALREVLAKPRCAATAEERQKFARERYSWPAAIDSYFKIASLLVQEAEDRGRQQGTPTSPRSSQCKQASSGSR